MHRSLGNASDDQCVHVEESAPFCMTSRPCISKLRRKTTCGEVGYSKERRVDPQIVVGLLVDRTGFPLEIGCYEGSKAETHTIIPVIKALQDRHGVTDMVVAADAGACFSAKNLTELDQAGLRFIVGSRQTKAPHDLATHFQWNGDWAADGQVIDTITPKGTKRLDPDRVKKKREPVWSAEEFPDAWRR